MSSSHGKRSMRSMGRVVGTKRGSKYICLDGLQLAVWFLLSDVWLFLRADYVMKLRKLLSPALPFSELPWMKC